MGALGLLDGVLIAHIISFTVSLNTFPQSVFLDILQNLFISLVYLKILVRFTERVICQHPLRILPHLCKGVARSKEFSYSYSLTLTRFMGFLQRIPFLRPYQSYSEQSERSFCLSARKRGRSVARRSFSAQCAVLYQKLWKGKGMSYFCRFRVWRSLWSIADAYWCEVNCCALWEAAPPPCPLSEGAGEL